MGVIVIALIGVAIYVSIPKQTITIDPDATGPAVDSGARIQIEQMRGQLNAQTEAVAELNAKIAALEQKIDALRTAPAANPPTLDGSQTLFNNGRNEIIDRYAQIVLIPGRRKVNGPLRLATPTFLEQTLGRPRANLSDRCQSMTNPKLANMLVTETVGPIRVRMLQPAVDSLRRVFNKIEETDPDLYVRINTAGSLCVRQIRGTRGRTSTHSFGLSIDLNIDGKLDTLGDGKTQLGLTIIADFFKEEGWIWGAAFSREDSMHFEVSRDMVEKWRSEGKI